MKATGHIGLRVFGVLKNQMEQNMGSAKWSMKRIWFIQALYEGMYCRGQNTWKRLYSTVAGFMW